MFNPIKVITTLAFLALAAPLYAQDATDPVTDPVIDPAAEPATDPAAEPVPDPASDLSMGEPAVGEQYLRETFGDWSIRCQRAAEGADPCQLYQLLMDADGNAVAEINMVPLPEGGEAVAGATIVAPLETLLTEQITISVDGTGARRYQFKFCNRAGCIAQFGFTAEQVAQFKAGATASLRIVPAAAPDEQVVLSISLVGFTAGFEAADTPPTAPQE